MFGSTNPFGSQSIAPSMSPFGGGQANTAPSAFGQPAASTGPFGTSVSSTSTGFGGGFGSSNLGSSSVTPGAGGFGGFGSATSTQQPSFGFGSTQGQPTPGLFGTSTNAATSTNPVNPFGVPQTSTTSTGGGGIFGAPSSTPSGGSLFGAPSGGGGGAIGSSTMSTTGSSTAFGGFGSTMTSNPTPAFGSASTTPSMFGTSTSTRPGGLFGSTSTSTGFGSLSSTASTPLMSNTSSAFGSNIQPSTGMTFGSSTTSTPSGGGFFGSTSSVVPQTSQQSGTASVPYQQTSKPDGNVTIMMQTITAMPVFENKSLEELRCEDYMAGNRGTQGQQQQQQVSTFGGFGTSAPSTGVFGAPSQPLSSGFAPMSTTGGTTGGLFGSTASTSAPNPFATSNTSTSVFGAKPLGTGFGTTTMPTTTSTFGATTSTGTGFGGFGSVAKPATTGGLFGAPTPSTTGSLFGSAPATTTAPTTSLFGAAPSQPTPGLFGSTTPAPSFGSTGGFGSTTAQSGSLFGATAQAPATSTTGGLFGAAPSTTTTNPVASGGLFGAPASSTGGGLFGASTPTAQSGGFFGSSSSSTAPTTGGLFGTPTPAGGGLFGSAPKPATGSFLGGSLFTSPNAQTGTGVFGSTLPVATPTNATSSASPGGGLFGSSFSGGLFGSTPTHLPTPSNASSISVPPSADTLLAQQLAVIEAQKKELSLLDAWRGTSSTGSRVVAYSQPEPVTALRALKHSSFQPSSASTPFMSPPLQKSIMKVLPRGYTSTSSSSSRPNVESETISNRTPPILSPNAYLGISNKTLVIKSKLTPKPKMNLNLVDEDWSEKSTSQIDPGSGTSLLHNRMSIGSVESTENGHDSERLDIITTHRNGHEKASFLSPGLGTFENTSQTVPEHSSGKKTDHRIDTSYDFYQKVISSPLAADSSLLSPSFIPEKKTSAVPKLTKKGYRVSPTLENLSNMTEADLAAVMSFTVSRDGFGSVEWEGAVDVRGVDLDSVVDIDSQTVAVYSLEEAQGIKPPIGSKLNRPAVITILNVYPKEATDLSADSKLKFSRKIAKLTKKADAELISYDVDSGEWKFRVYHFSRYGLLDDESDDEDHPDNKPNNSVENVEKAMTRFRIPSCLAEDLLDDDDRASPMLYSEEVSLKGANDDILIRAAEDAYKLFTLDENYHSGGLDNARGHGEPLSTCQRFEDEGPTDMNFYLPLRSFQGYVNFNRPSSICAKIALRSGLIQGSSSQTDFGLRMGRSFRVGWRPDGSLVYPNIMNQPNILSTFRPIISPEDQDGSRKSMIIQILSTHSKHSLRQPRNDSPPSFTWPESSDQRFSAALRDFKDTSSHQIDTTDRVVRLAFYLLHIVTQWNDVDRKRKLSALRLWFQKASQDVGKSADDLQSIYLALCDNDHTKANSIAYANEYLQLSALIANASFQASLDIKEQYKLWCTSGTLPLVSPSLASLYAMRSGEVMQYDENCKSSSVSSVWRRSMGMLLFRQDNVDHLDSDISILQRLVTMYEDALQKGTVPAPIAWYLNPKSAQVKELCLLYQLFLMFSNKKLRLVDIINPKGYTSYHHDLLHTFLLASAISASHDLPSVSAEEGLFICDNLAGQLISAGLWEWAVYIYLVQFGHENDGILKRMEKAKEIVLRYFDGFSTSKHYFLHHDMGIPEKWLEESLAYRCQYNFDPKGFIQHSSRFSKEVATSAYREVILTEKIFAGGEENCNEVAKFLEQHKPIHDKFASAVNDYLELSRDLNMLLHSQRRALDSNKLDALETKLRTLYLAFTALEKDEPKRVRFPNHASVPESICIVELRDAISLHLVQVKNLRNGFMIQDGQCFVHDTAVPTLKLASQMSGHLKRRDSHTSTRIFKGVISSEWIRGQCSI